MLFRSSIAYRHERVLRFWEAQGVNPMPKIVFGELSNGVGGVEPDLTKYMEQITLWDEHVMRSRWRNQIIGAALYGYNVAENIGTAAGRIATWIADHPTPTDPVDPIDPPPADIPQWHKTVILVPQSLPQAKYIQVCSTLAFEGKTEVAFSADSAFDWPQHAKTLRVVIVNPRLWGGATALLEWAQATYGRLPTVVEYREV